jgi:hypothetical protein
MSSKEKTKTKIHLGVQLPVEERQVIEKEAQRYHMKTSDWVRRTLRAGAREDIIKKDFV